MFDRLKRRFSALMASAFLAGALVTTPTQSAAQEFWIGQLIPVGFNFCPRSTLPANGQLLPIASNSALFSLLGTIYGGDGRTTFALPDLRGRSATHAGTGPGLSPMNLGARGGAEFHTLSVNQMPAHSHGVLAHQANGDRQRPNSDFIAGSDAGDRFSDQDPTARMDPRMIENAGGGQQFAIRDPYLAVNWCVVTQGIYPSRN